MISQEPQLITDGAINPNSLNLFMERLELHIAVTIAMNQTTKYALKVSKEDGSDNIQLPSASDITGFNFQNM